MIAEFAIIPDVFDPKSYPSSDAAESSLHGLMAICREEAFVRDLYDGAWSRQFKQNLARWHASTKEVIETLVKENRLRRFPRKLQHLPGDDAEWCYEAASDRAKPAPDMIIAGDPATLGYEDDCITPVMKIHKTRWWQNRSSSVRVKRQTEDYLKTLGPILKHANLFMFIDPHVDEREQNYAEFSQILQKIGHHPRSPRIEIHIWGGKGTSSRSDWDARTQKTHEVLTKARLNAAVYVWSGNFHDRYLITDLVGISLPNGFDIATKNAKETNWARLGRNDREKTEMDFDLNGQRFGEANKFIIGYQS